MKTVLLMGGLGNVLFQLNYVAYLQTLGIPSAVSTFVLERGETFAKYASLADHDTLQNLMRLEALAGFEICDMSIWDLIKVKASKALGRKIQDVLYVSHGDEEEALRKGARKMVGYFHQNVPLQRAFVQHLKSRLEHELMGVIGQGGLQKDAKAIDDCGIVVHYRGGDFSSAMRLDGTNDDYYSKSLVGEKKVCVVTMDKQSAEKTLSSIPSLEDVEYVGGQDVISDMWLMGRARKLIASNSTLCWWSAELGSNNTVIQPRVFYPHIPNWSPSTFVQKRVTL